MFVDIWTDSDAYTTDTYISTDIDAYTTQSV